jgi:hypothetical protein
MKTCRVCALVVEDTFLFCPDDGSSLWSASSGSNENESVGPSSADDKTALAVVLYCPTCASEYPLTFSECPMHGVQLTKYNVTKPSDKERSATAELLTKHLEASLSNQLTHLDLMRPQIDRPRRVVEVATPGGANAFDHPQHAAADLSQEDDLESGYLEPGLEVHERGSGRPGFRVAAITTVIALAVFALVGMYSFISNLSKRRSTAVVRVATATEAPHNPFPFVPTPQEAQDYKEEQPAPDVSTLPGPRAAKPGDRKGNEASASTTERNVRSTTVLQPDPKPRAAKSSEPPATTKVLTSPMPALPRGNSGGFDARLIRARSRKTLAGFRYDLTFNMQEQAGRAAQWQRVLISTRSASGISHSEAIPFSHRLGAAGALTFTISVELTGRSVPDWQGRIVCTTLGWDNRGAPLQASFGANVTP